MTTAIQMPVSTNRAVQARASAATTPPCGVSQVIAPLLGTCDMAVSLHEDVVLPTSIFMAGDILLTNKSIEPAPGDTIVVLLPRAKNRVVDHAEWMRIKATERVIVSAVLVGYIRSVGGLS